MQFNKSYRLLRYLNRRHSVLSRHFLGAFAWLGGCLFSQSTAVGGLLRRDFIRDDFRLAFRRAGWFAGRVFPKLNIFEDPFFDFTMETNAQERAGLERFIKRYRKRLSDSVYSTDLLYIHAADLHGLLEQDRRGFHLNQQVTAFYDEADRALAALPACPPPTPTADIDRKDDFSKRDAVEALQDFADALPLEQWCWYLVSGTFLGLHREGGFLAHDYDIDIGIHGESVSVDNLIATLDAHSRFVTKKVDHHIDITQDAEGYLRLVKVPALVKLIHQNGLNLDVFIHYTENGNCWHGSIIHRWENSPFALVRSELEGVPVYIPEDADSYLTENYGDWKTPVKDFDCTTGTPNLVVSRNFLSVALFLKRLAVFSTSDGLQAKKLRRTLLASGVTIEQEGDLKVVRNFQQLQPSPERVCHDRP